MKVRDVTCLRCGYRHVKRVVLSPHTQNLSGEQSAWCPECGSKEYVASPHRDEDKRDEAQD